MNNTNSIAVDRFVASAQMRDARNVEMFSARDRMRLASDLLPPCDFFAVLIAAYLSTYVSTFVDATGVVSHVLHGSVALLGASLATYVLYDENFATAASECRTATLLRSFFSRAAITVAIVYAISSATTLLDAVSNTWLHSWLICSLALTGLTRIVVARRVCLLRSKGALNESIAVVGAGPLAERLDRHLRESKAPNVELLGIFEDAATLAAAKNNSAWPIYPLDKLVELSRTRKLDWIVITVAEGEEERLQQLVKQLRVLAVPIAMCPQDVGSQLYCKTVDYVGNGMPVLLLADRPIRRWNSIAKTAEDIVLGWTLTLLALPLLAAIALAIRLTSPGPVIFKQRRHAFNNTEFEIYKFRTMHWQPSFGAKIDANSEKLGDRLRQTSRNDDRVTPIGRWLRKSSLDELPQLFNVIKGDMSLVGPRPHAVNMRTEDRLGCEITECYVHRHRVKPGLTGWAQVNGARGATKTVAQLQRRIDLDLYYIDHWSPWFDCKILFMTAGAVVEATNAF